MKFYGSIQNRMNENSVQKVPEVGMGATMTMYTDRYACTILEVSKETIKHTYERVRMDDGSIKQVTNEYPKYILVTEDDFKLISGSRGSENQECEYITDKNLDHARKFIFHKASGIYREATRESKFINGRLESEYKNTVKAGNQSLVIGFKETYIDPSF